VREYAVEGFEPVLRFLRVGIERSRRHVQIFSRYAKLPHARMGPLRSLERSKPGVRGRPAPP
jgi:hypothetical protein